jgi:hypothetical protein
MRKAIKIKDDLHSLIDKTENNTLLEIVYQLLDSKGGDKEGELIKNLTPDQKLELHEAYDESFDEANLIDLQKLKTKHSKWFEK